VPDSRPVLLVMDYQHAIVERIAQPPVLAAAVRAVAAARSAAIPVMFVRVAFRPGFPEVAASNAVFSAAAAHGGSAYHQDDPATQIHAALEPRPDEPVILKRRVSAFAGSDLDVLLRGAGADTLVLAGLSTSGVVLSTLGQAADLDYRLVVLADACADPDVELHRTLVEKVFPKRGRVTTTDEWITSVS
jgi:nicotinamidase-related amidase